MIFTYMLVWRQPQLSWLRLLPMTRGICSWICPKHPLHHFGSLRYWLFCISCLTFCLPGLLRIRLFSFHHYNWNRPLTHERLCKLKLLRHLELRKCLWVLAEKPVKHIRLDQLPLENCQVKNFHSNQQSLVLWPLNLELTKKRWIIINAYLCKKGNFLEPP